MKWGCIKCGTEIPQDREFCDVCEERQFKKIRGFLVLPFAGLFLMGFIFPVEITGFFFKIITINYNNLTENGKLYFLISMFIDSVMFLFITYIISLFIKKKKTLPKAYIGLIIATIATMSFKLYLYFILLSPSSIGYNELVPIFRNILSAFIWIPYFLVSERVKRTFVN